MILLVVPTHSSKFGCIATSKLATAGYQQKHWLNCCNIFQAENFDKSEALNLIIRLFSSSSQVITIYVDSHVAPQERHARPVGFLVTMEYRVRRNLPGYLGEDASLEYFIIQLPLCTLFWKIIMFFVNRVNKAVIETRRFIIKNPFDIQNHGMRLIINVLIDTAMVLMGSRSRACADKEELESCIWPSTSRRNRAI